MACNGGGLIQNDLIILERERERERERENRLQHKSKSGLISFVQKHKQLKIQKNMHFLLLESQKSPIVKKPGQKQKHRCDFIHKMYKENTLDSKGEPVLLE